MIVEVWTGSIVGVECVPVRVEVSVSDGLPSIQVVGLPHGAVREGKDRVRAALHAAGFVLPPRRITVNLAPADLPKEGSGFDLPLALGLLAGAGHLPPSALEGGGFLGELGLNGELRRVRGALAFADALGRRGAAFLVVPAGCGPEAAADAGAARVHGAHDLLQVVAHLRGEHRMDAVDLDLRRWGSAGGDGPADLSDVRGQAGPKRALEVAAAGGHNLLLTGPPGSGKTMLARRLAGILPPLTLPEAREVTTVHSVAGLLREGEALVRHRPFRAPHHSTSMAGLVGGGRPIRPGEATLAHGGVLFLDELPEFSRLALEALRQPIEDGWVTVARVGDRVRFPARFTLVAAMNPCPCGHLGDARQSCTCDPTQVARYRARVSGPLRDRMDMTVHVPAIPFAELTTKPTGEGSLAVRSRVAQARARQRERWEGRGEGDGRPGGRGPIGGPFAWNAALSPSATTRWCRLDRAGERLLEDAADRMGLSARGVHRVLRVARTIADLDGVDRIGEEHLAEAVQYRG